MNDLPWGGERRHHGCRAVAGHPASWTVLDPASLLITSSLCEGEAELPREMLEWEYLEDDAMKKSADVARSERGIHTLLEATGGDPTRSRAYRE